jgi:hypothetical protein
MPLWKRTKKRRTLRFPKHGPVYFYQHVTASVSLRRGVQGGRASNGIRIGDLNLNRTLGHWTWNGSSGDLPGWVLALLLSPKRS